MTIYELKKYEENQFVKAIFDGTEKAWRNYRANVKKAVRKFNREHEEQVDIDALMA